MSLVGEKNEISTRRQEPESGALFVLAGQFTNETTKDARLQFMKCAFMKGLYPGKRIINRRKKKQNMVENIDTAFFSHSFAAEFSAETMMILVF